MMAALQGNAGGLRASLLRSVRLVMWVVAPICLGLIVVLPDFVQVALTDKWHTITPIVQILCVNSLVRSVSVLLPSVLLARGRANFLFCYNLALFGVMPLVFWLGASWSGAWGVAVGWLVVYPMFQIHILYKTLNEIDLAWKVLWVQIWRPLAAVVVTFVAALVAQWFMSAWSYPALARLIVTLVLGASIYGAAFLWIGGRSRGEIWEVAGWLIHRDKKIARAGKKAARLA
jgi:lipopolysaccharide exporter